MKSDQLTIGILAHVDAGKTTLAEAILYLTGRIRRLGRVDHQDAFLDNFALERSRGITIFSKQAQVVLPKDMKVTLLDTPGHVDFSAEMERTLQVLDYALLVISAPDGVQSHAETLWRLLARYRIPVFLFINKMDRPGTEKAALIDELDRRLDEHCVDFTAGNDSEEFFESLAMCDDELLDEYLSDGKIRTGHIQKMIADRKIFPCYFGSALKLQGIEELLDGFSVFCVLKDYPEEFGARVYKITRDSLGNRMTHMKITGGTLHVRDLISGPQNAGSSSGTVSASDAAADGQIQEEKVNQIRIFSGAEYEIVQAAAAGTICAVTGPVSTYAGEGLGAEQEAEVPLLEPVLSYRIELPEGTDVQQAYRQLKLLEEEEPQLHISWETGGPKTGEIHAQLMGEVQTEVLQNIISDRCGYKVRFGEGSIVYRETIAAPVVGMGHFEPLRHYAEVHLLLEPLERGSGLQFESACSEDMLDKSWQRLIMTHLEEKNHIGVLTGAEITDMKITLIAGRAHQKHTEGGDFRQATYRALRQGLCRARSVLLEPVYSFRLEIPMEDIGRAISDIQRMYGSFSPPEISGDTAVITGSAPVVTMRGYSADVLSYTRGRGKFSCRLKGYEECHNSEEVIEERGYDALADTDNPCGSVFCVHGAGFAVSWDQVPDYVHIPDTDSFAPKAPPHDAPEVYKGAKQGVPSGKGMSSGSDILADDEELRAIFERTYGSAGREHGRFPYKKKHDDYNSRWAGYEASAKRTGAGSAREKEPVEECLVVDGYNIIFSWDELNRLSKENLESARSRLLDIMCNYQGYKDIHLIVVFDAYRVAGHNTEVSKYNNIYVVYTKEAEIADQYIEKTVRKINHRYHITVATSDALEQVVILGAGAYRLSARDLHKEVEMMYKDLRDNYLNISSKGGKVYLLDGKEEIRGIEPDGESRH